MHFRLRIAHWLEKTRFIQKNISKVLKNFFAQELEALAKYVSDYKLPNEFLQMASNFHFLLFLYTNKFVEIGAEELEQLAGIVRTGDAEKAKKWVQDNPNWGTLTILLNELATSTKKG